MLAPIRLLVAGTLCVVLLGGPPGLAREDAGTPTSAGGFLICYPNAPGDTEQAQPVMRHLGAYLGERLDGRYAPVYHNEVEAARAHLAANAPRYGILSLDVFLSWREELDLVPIAQTERGGRTEERYFLLVATDAPHTGLADLAVQAERLGRPVAIWSSHLDDARFAQNVVFAGKLALRPEGPVQVVSTKQPLRALRRLVSAEDFGGAAVDAILVDESTWEGLQQLRSFDGVLRVLYTSPALPTPPVVAFPAAAAAERARMVEVLSGTRADPEGRKLLETLQLTGFAAGAPRNLERAVASYAEEVP